MQLLPLEWIRNEILLYSTGNSIYSLMMEDNVRKRMYMCMCDWVTLLYGRKLTEHCKPTVMEKRKSIFKKLPGLGGAREEQEQHRASEEPESCSV